MQTTPKYKQEEEVKINEKFIELWENDTIDEAASIYEQGIKSPKKITEQ